ncbi:MAG: magnesium/cobalt transporter CorA [Lentisphaerae bacterium]|nr:magnesium/cobalt transporter CorA [Lentisphaerota bacterium]
MVRYFIFSKGRLIQESSDVPFLKVALYEEGVDIWVDIEQPTPEENRQVLEQIFSFHPLAIEDCVAVSERPKIDQYDGYFFMVVHALDFSRHQHQFATSELNLFIGRNFLVTYHLAPVRSIGITIDRVLKNPSLVARSPDRLTYYILDLLLDNYEPALQDLASDMADIEASMLAAPSKTTLAEIVHLKTQIQTMRQIMVPQREVIARVAHGEFTPVRASMLPYYRDLLDHLSHILDMAETHRESLSNTIQILLNLQQSQTNQVIKVLTVLATLSMPLLIVTSFYGMNIRHFPNTDGPSWPLAYLWTLGLSGLVTILVYAILKRKEWL